MKPADVIKKLEARRSAVVNAAISVMRKFGPEGVRVAQSYSQGSLSSVMLRRMGRPYRTRGGSLVPVNPEIINIQSARFFHAWKSHMWMSGGNIGMQIINDAPYAGYLDKGTRNMIHRPIREAVVRKFERPFRRAMVNAVRRALRK